MKFFEAYAAALNEYSVAHIRWRVNKWCNDDTLRHAITKASSIHFLLLMNTKKRIIQLGESPSRVFNVGALGLEVKQ